MWAVLYGARKTEKRNLLSILHTKKDRLQKERSSKRVLLPEVCQEQRDYSGEGQKSARANDKVR